MSRSARIVSLVLAAAMFGFSCWMYLRTGDWAAALFALGSLGYGYVFGAGLFRQEGDK